MSAHFLVVIPQDPKASLPEGALALRDSLALMAGTDEARVKDFQRLQFIDCGENFERVLCPKCREELSTAWWGKQMDNCWDEDRGFKLHAHAMPCCGAAIALDGLVYEPSQGFASWFVSARNPGRKALTDTEMRELEAIAGLKLIAISQMY